MGLECFKGAHDNRSTNYLKYRLFLQFSAAIYQFGLSSRHSRSKTTDTELKVVYTCPSFKLYLTCIGTQQPQPPRIDRGFMVSDQQPNIDTLLARISPDNAQPAAEMEYDFTEDP
mgnify:CR=1 FL=1